MRYKTVMKTGLAALVALSFVITGYVSAGSSKGDGVDRSQYTEMSAKELAEHLIFKTGSFDVDEETQEGSTVRDRLKQDEVQKTCSALKGEPVGDATAKKVRRDAEKSVRYPDGGIELGNWQQGQALAENAFGFRVGHKVDDHQNRSPGGMCMNCHALEPAKAGRSGTIGPSLVGYGMQRGTSDETLKYTYEVIYNVHTAFPCAAMPRFGTNGVLDKEQIQDIMAYLLDSDSPVNQ